MSAAGKLSERVLISSFAIVVACFLVSAGYSQYRVRYIDDDPLSIAHQAIPSIEPIFAARAQLLHLRRLCHRYSASLDQKQPVDVTIPQRVQARLDEELGFYASLPFFSEER